jgi:hypothetical protein
MKSSLHSLIPFLPSLLNHLRLPSQGTPSIQSLSSLRALIYSLGAAPTENTASQKFLYCYRGVFSSPLHRNGSSSIVACVFISAELVYRFVVLALNYSDLQASCHSMNRSETVIDFNLTRSERRKDFYILGYNAVQSIESQPTFRINTSFKHSCPVFYWFALVLL